MKIKMFIRQFAVAALLLGMSLPATAQEFFLTVVHKEYYPDGKIKSKAQYRNGKQDGYVREYYPNGRLAFVQYIDHGKINGPVKAYYPNGKLKGETFYVNNSEDGRMRAYYEDGKIKEEALYVRGQMIQLKSFDTNGRLISTQESNLSTGCAIIENPSEGF